MTDDEITAHLVAELEQHAPLELVMRPLTVFNLCGLLQLLLRHPHLGDSSRQCAWVFLEHARAYFADCPTVLEVLRRGDNPKEDR